MKYLFMVLVPIISTRAWIFFSHVNTSYFLYVSIIAFIATLLAFLFEMFFSHKLSQNQIPGANFAPGAAIPKSMNIASITILVYCVTFLFGSGVFALIETGTATTTSSTSKKSEISITNMFRDTEKYPIKTKQSSNIPPQPVYVSGSRTTEINEANTHGETASNAEIGYITGNIITDATSINPLVEAPVSNEPFGDTSLEGDAGIADLISRGYLRIATVDDHETWLHAVFETPESYITKKTGYPLLQIDKDLITSQFKQESFGKEYYVAVRNFSLPKKIYWKHNFYIPKGIMKPTGDLSNAVIYDFNTLSCINCYLNLTGFSDTNLPLPTKTFDENTQYFAGGAYGGKEIQKQIDTSGFSASTFDVYVNYDKKPVVLILGAYRPSIWYIHKTEGTNITKVILGGYNKQEVIGLSESAIVERHIYDETKSNDYFYIMKEGTLVSSLRKYGNVTEIVYADNNGKITFGDVLNGNEKWTDLDQRASDALYNREDELAGEAGLEALVKKGVLRHATDEDYAGWAEAITSAPNTYVTKKTGYPIPPDTLSSVKNTILSNFNHATIYYVALQNFTLPGGMYWKFGFLIPKGIDMPEGAITNGVIYDFNTLSCTGFCSYSNE